VGEEVERGSGSHASILIWIGEETRHGPRGHQPEVEGPGLVGSGEEEERGKHVIATKKSK